MHIRLTDVQQALIQQAIAAGRIKAPDDAAREAMALWEEREQRRAAILARIDAAEACLARGDGIAITPEAMRQLAQDVKQRGRAMLEAGAPPAPLMAHRLAAEAAAELDRFGITSPRRVAGSNGPTC